MLTFEDDCRKRLERLFVVPRTIITTIQQLSGLLMVMGSLLGDFCGTGGRAGMYVSQTLAKSHIRSEMVQYEQFIVSYEPWRRVE